MPGLCEKGWAIVPPGNGNVEVKGREGRKERERKENRKEVTMMKPQEERTGG